MFILMGLRIQNQIKMGTTSTKHIPQDLSSGTMKVWMIAQTDTKGKHKEQVNPKFIVNLWEVEWPLHIFLHLSSLQGETIKGWFHYVKLVLFQQTQWTVFCSCKATASQGYIWTNVLLCSQHCTRSYIMRTQTQYLFNHCNTLHFYSVVFQYTHTGV